MRQCTILSGRAPLELPTSSTSTQMQADVLLYLSRAALSLVWMGALSFGADPDQSASKTNLLPMHKPIWLNRFGLRNDLL